MKRVKIMELVCDVKQEFCEEEIIKQDEADVGIKTELDSNYAPSAIKVFFGYHTFIRGYLV